MRVKVQRADLVDEICRQIHKEYAKKYVEYDKPYEDLTEKQKAWGHVNVVSVLDAIEALNLAVVSAQ